MYKFTLSDDDSDDEAASSSNAGRTLIVRVCKKTFVDCLGVSASRINRLLGKKVRNPVHVADRRGQQKNAKRITDVRLQYVKDHISSYPTEESHQVTVDLRTLKPSTSLLR